MSFHRDPGATLHGREKDCAQLDAHLGAGRSGESRTVVVRGEAGIGKTALLDYVGARSTDCRVLRVSGVESEMELPFAAVHQLSQPFLDGLGRLPAPHRGALETVLGRGLGAGMLVLGSGTPGGTVSAVWRRARGTTSGRVASRAHVPLVIVTLADHPCPGPSRGRVVVGVADPDRSRQAVAFAFEAAQRLRAGLTAVRAWTPAGADPTPVEHAVSGRRHQESLERIVGPCQDQYPDVDVRQRVVPRAAVAALLDEAAGATLLVLGARHHRGVPPPLSGGVRRALLGQVHSPVVIVPPVRPARPHRVSWRYLIAAGGPPPP